MEIIDGQLHEPTIWMDWQGASKEEWHRVLTEAMLTLTDAVGVRGAVIMPSTDPEWAEEIATMYPSRFAVVPRLSPGNADPDGKLPDPQNGEMDPAAPDIKEQIEETWSRKAVKGIRFSISFWADVIELYYAGRFDQAFEACSELGIPAFMFVSGNMEIADQVAAKYPNLPIVIDHLGLKQLPLEEEDSPPWRRLDELLALAKYPNVVVKVCAPPAMSKEGFPYRDCWPPVERMLESFGVDRLFWASDISRVRGRIGPHSFEYAHEGDYPGKHTYAESLAFFSESSLSESEKAMILGGTIRQFLKWPASA